MTLQRLDAVMVEGRLGRVVAVNGDKYRVCVIGDSVRSEWHLESELERVERRYELGSAINLNNEKCMVMRYTDCGYEVMGLKSHRVYDVQEKEMNPIASLNVVNM